MSFAIPEPARTEFTATFAVVPADQSEGLTCFLCWGPRVEWHTTLRLGGRTMGVGVHECCIEVVQRPTSRKDDRK